MSLWIGLKPGGRGIELAPLVMSCYNFGFDPIDPWQIIPYEFQSASYLAGFPIFTQYKYLFEVKFTSGSGTYTELTTANQAQDLAYLLGSAAYEPPINFIKITFKGTMFLNL